jgi:hypothetical protein
LRITSSYEDERSYLVLQTLPFPEFTQLAEPRRASDHILVIKVAAAAAPPKAVRGLVTTSTEVSWIGGESSKINLQGLASNEF